jgi:hypothetical protein
VMEVLSKHLEKFQSSTGVVKEEGEGEGEEEGEEEEGEERESTPSPGQAGRHTSPPSPDNSPPSDSPPSSSPLPGQPSCPQVVLYREAIEHCARLYRVMVSVRT